LVKASTYFNLKDAKFIPTIFCVLLALNIMVERISFTELTSSIDAPSCTSFSKSNLHFCLCGLVRLGKDILGAVDQQLFYLVLNAGQLVQTAL